MARVSEIASIYTRPLLINSVAGRSLFITVNYYIIIISPVNCSPTNWGERERERRRTRDHQCIVMVWHLAVWLKLGGGDGVGMHNYIGPT